MVSLLEFTESAFIDNIQVSVKKSHVSRLLYLVKNAVLEV